MSPEATLQTNSAVVLCASESVQPDKSQPLPRLHCELSNQTSEQPIDRSPSAPLPASALSPQQESRPGSDGSRARREEIPPSEGSSLHIPTTEMNPWPATAEDVSVGSPTSRLCLEPTAERAAAPSVTRGFEAAVGMRELVAGTSDDSTWSAVHHDGGAPALSSLVAQSQPSLGAEGEAPLSPELTEKPPVSPGVTEASQNLALQSVSSWEARRDAPQISPDTSLENPPDTSPEVSERRSERDVSVQLMPSVAFVSGLVSLSIVLQEPSTLFIFGLLLVLHRL